MESYVIDMRSRQNIRKITSCLENDTSKDEFSRIVTDTHLSDDEVYYLLAMEVKQVKDLFGLDCSKPSPNGPPEIDKRHVKSLCFMHLKSSHRQKKDFSTTFSKVYRECDRNSEINEILDKALDMIFPLANLVWAHVYQLDEGFEHQKVSSLLQDMSADMEQIDTSPKDNSNPFAEYCQNQVQKILRSKPRQADVTIKSHRKPLLITAITTGAIAGAALLAAGALHFIRVYGGLITANTLKVPSIVLLGISIAMLVVAIVTGLLSRQDSLPRVDKSDEVPASGNRTPSIGLPPALSLGMNEPNARAVYELDFN